MTTVRVKTMGLQRIKDILQAELTEANDSVSRSANKEYNQGRMDAYASALGVVNIWGPNAETEAYEEGYQVGHEAERTPPERH